MQGWFKTHRKIIESPVYSEPGKLRLWIYCLSKATYKKTEVLVGNTLVKLEPGQFITGRSILFNDYNRGLKPKDRVAEITLWRWLLCLEKMKNVNIKKTNKFSVVTIVNWALYQVDDVQNEQQNEQVEDDEMNNKRTTNEQQMNTNKKLKKEKDIYSLLAHWNSKNIIVHSKLNDKAKSHISARLDESGFAELLKAIDNYAEVLKNEKYFWSYRWTLGDFMKPNNAIRFLESSKPLETFIDNTNNKGKTDNSMKYNSLDLEDLE